MGVHCNKEIDNHVLYYIYATNGKLFPDIYV